MAKQPERYENLLVPLTEEDFPETEAIKNQLGLAQQQCRELQVTLEQLKRLREDFQATCSHVETTPLVQYDADFPNCDTESYGMNVYVGKRCNACKLIILRRKGGQSQICFKCGEDMEHKGTVPGQGSRLQVYKCTNQNCRHEYCHA